MNVTAPELQVTGRYPDCARTYSKGTVGGGQGSSAPQPVTEDQGGELCANTQTHVMACQNGFESSWPFKVQGSREHCKVPILHSTWHSV